MPDQAYNLRLLKWDHLTLILSSLREVTSIEHGCYILPQLERVTFNCFREAVGPYDLSHFGRTLYHLLGLGPALGLNAIDSHCSNPNFSSSSETVVDFSRIPELWHNIFCQFSLALELLFRERICWSHLAITRSLYLHVLDLYFFSC